MAAAGMEKPTIASYDECLTRLLTGLLERPDQREGMFSRLLLEAPVITPNAIMVLRKYCQDEVSAQRITIRAQHWHTYLLT